MKGILIKKVGCAELVEFKDELKNLYRLTDCDCIDVVTRKIGEKYYSIVIDDEGLWKDYFVVTAVDKKNERMLVGNLLITNSNDEGELTGLEQEDIDNITMHLKALRTREIIELEG